MAILNALATRQGSSISDLSGYQSSLVGNQIITHGKSTCKLTGCFRREDPTEDAAVIREIRQSLGYQISIRVDANRKWTYDKAVQFATSVKHCALEYIEEPVCFEDDIITFCEETGLFVALDETIDNITWENLHKLGKFVHPGIIAVVIKPSVVGGFENALLIAKWAQKHEKMAIVSSTFESGLGLSAYVQFAQIIEDSNKAISEIRKIKYRRTVAHGLGTFQWLKQDVSIEALKISVPPKGSRVEAFVVDADTYVRNFQLNHEVVVRKYGGEQLRSYNLEVNTKYISYRFKLLESVCAVDGKVVIFLHGFLGSSQDWIPLMKALSGTTQCIAVDLPGHGESRVRYHTEVSKQEPYLSFESVTEALVKLICETTTSRVILVGYSMGGRMALHMSLKYSEKVDGAVIISGSPGLRDEITQRICISQDKSRALYLLSHGLPTFLDTWYEGSLWKSLRAHPLFNKIKSSHGKHQDTKGLAKALTDLSIGRQRPLWNELKQCKKPLLLLVGEKDMEFRGIAEEMCREMESSPNGEVDGKGNLCQVFIVPDCGHAVHLENPLPVVNAMRKFLTRVSTR
ncbi:hypothetical protein HPP92_018830 [Vanilla planifolia]|uniref:Uncharacterized protein n=1 Tax=Vanilla planifolia TaxID=51239 RepID=A0A835UMC8_VANPL|nr:hypothetical protein HPP92_018830 [Vanilla planifolia]